jgi:uncharacterized protein (DUF1501 family)
MPSSRRDFLRRSLCAGIGAAGASSLIGDLTHVAALTPQSSDYKALVCVFLFGGNDASNTLVPYSQTDYTAYARARGNLALARDTLLPVTPLTRDGRDFALHASLTEMQALFAQRKLAIVSNVGPLLAPTTRQQYLNESVPLPPQLFSHNDQQVHWQTSRPDEIAKTGWGGRMADAVNALNTNAQISMSVSLTGSNIYQVGGQVLPYMISSGGAPSLWYYNEAWGNPETLVTKSMLEAPYANVMERSYRDTFKRALDNSIRLNAVLSSAPRLTTVFSDRINLSKQLSMVAKLISVRGQLGLKRQIFFCSADGYDTHGDQITPHANLLRELSQSLNSFYQATVELGVASQVTTFTASDFGRTYKSNGKGSDHGWGGHQLVLGGAVKGGEIYGRVPVLQIDGPDDSGDGRWIPTIAVDEYSATLARWFGVGQSDLPAVLPNIGRFARTDLGFMQ